VGITGLCDEVTNAVAPVITIIISLIIYMVIPHPIIITGMIMALISIFLMAIEDEDESAQEQGQ
jgi:predicted NBD/HSP70 family sugar kinase